MLSIIAAMAENNVIGKDNSLIWSLPEDLKRFKEITMTGSKTMIMGRRTFESLPFVLPGRKHIVLSSNKEYKVDNENVMIIHDADELKPLIESPEEYFVIGGGEIFTQMLPYTNRLYLTLIHESFEGDTLFPEFNRMDWKIIERIENPVSETNTHENSFMILEKI